MTTLIIGFLIGIIIGIIIGWLNKRIKYAKFQVFILYLLEKNGQDLSKLEDEYDENEKDFNEWVEKRSKELKYINENN